MNCRRDPFEYYRRLGNLRDWIESHLDDRIALADAAEIAGMSPSHFSRFFSRAIGQPFSMWLAETRTREAARLLTLNNRSIVEVADMVGFGSVRTLQRHFRAAFGMSPSTYRDRFRESTVDAP